MPLAGPDGLQRRGGSEQVLTPVGGVHSVITHNGYCANHSEYQRDHGCRYDSGADYHAMFNILSGSGL